MEPTERSYHKDTYVNTVILIIKAVALTVQKLLARLKFQRREENDRQDKNNMLPTPKFDIGDIKSWGFFCQNQTIIYVKKKYINSCIDIKQMARNKSKPFIFSNPVTHIH